MFTQTIATLAAVAATGCALAFVTAPADPIPTPAPVATSTPAPLFASIFSDPNTPACEYEDGSELTAGQVCRWDAGDAGNGYGSSFVVLMTGDGSPVYVYADGHAETVTIAGSEDDAYAAAADAGFDALGCAAGISVESLRLISDAGQVYGDFVIACE